MVGEGVSENIVAADVEKRLGVVLVSRVTVAVVGADVVGTDVAPEVVETFCVVEEEGVVRMVRMAVEVAAAGKLVEGTVLVALRRVPGRAEILLVMVAGDEEETIVEMMGSNVLEETKTLVASGTVVVRDAVVVAGANMAVAAVVMAELVVTDCVVEGGKEMVVSASELEHSSMVVLGSEVVEGTEEVVAERVVTEATVVVSRS